MAKRALAERVDRRRVTGRPRDEEACEALERFADDVSRGAIVVDADESADEIAGIRSAIASIRGPA